MITLDPAMYWQLRARTLEVAALRAEQRVFQVSAELAKEKIQRVWAQVAAMMTAEQLDPSDVYLWDDTTCTLTVQIKGNA